MAGLNRRSALTLLGAGAGLACFGQVALAFEASRGIRLIDSRIQRSLAKSMLPETGTPLFVLGDNPVRQWRDGLRCTIVSAGTAMAVVRWDKAIMLQGLAREDGLRVSTWQTPDRLFRVAIVG